MTEVRPSLPIPHVAPLAPPDGFSDRLAALGVWLDATQVERLGGFLAMLLAMNAQMNLTAITSPEAAWTRHVADALTLVPNLKALPAGARVIDVGSGGGVPGIPLAIALPDHDFTLVDATAKKCAFLSGVAKVLDLGNVEVLNGRAEDLAKGPLASAFDVATARAVGKLATLIGWTCPFVKPKGTLLFIKGERAAQELADAKQALRRFQCRHVETKQTPTGRIMVLERLP